MLTNTPPKSNTETFLEKGQNPEVEEFISELGYTPEKLTAGTPKLVVWVDRSPFQGGTFKFQSSVFGEFFPVTWMSQEVSKCLVSGL